MKSKIINTEELIKQEKSIWIFEHQRQKSEFESFIQGATYFVRSDYFFLKSKFFYLLLVISIILRPKTTFFITLPRKLSSEFISLFHSRIVFIEDGANAFRLLNILKKNLIHRQKIRWLGSTRSKLILDEYVEAGLKLKQIDIPFRISNYLIEEYIHHNLIFLSKARSEDLIERFPFIDQNKKTLIIKHPGFNSIDKCVGNQLNKDPYIYVIGNSAVVLDLLIKKVSFDWFLMSCEMKCSYTKLNINLVVRFCDKKNISIVKSYINHFVHFKINGGSK